MSLMSEADTCRKYVVPQLQAAGWEKEPHSIAEQRTFTDGRIIISREGHVGRRRKKRADYVLRYSRDEPIAIVEAKAAYKTPGDGLQQARDYAEILDLKFAYATNGHGIVEFDFITGRERVLSTFPSPEDLWTRLKHSPELKDIGPQVEALAPSYRLQGKESRYYQSIAIRRAINAILAGRRRVLLTMATGTGKTFVAFQICWRLWNGRWNRTGEPRRPRILYLADRNVLVDDPKAKMFVPFGDARFKIHGGEAPKSREMYFAIYQSIAKDSRRPGLYREFGKDFFDLIIVDECHRGSAKDESNWREILEYFEPAFQLGMTATPLRNDNADTYRYFGNPVYQYSLRQGIDDGFLAPYVVHRIISSVDAGGWRPTSGELDRYGRPIPDEEYTTRDFERSVALRARTEAIAQNITEFLSATDRQAKTIVFCVDQEHADEMRRAISNLNTDLVKDLPEYVCRITSDEGDIGRAQLARFQDLESVSPVVVTTSQLLTTGIDIPLCKNVVIARVVNSMTSFKQMIGRGTRVNEEYGKLFFTILDYTGSATRMFADPDFDGEPELLQETQMGSDGLSIPGATKESAEIEDARTVEEMIGANTNSVTGDSEGTRRKYYVDGGQVEIVSHVVYELDNQGRRVRAVKLTDYTAEKVRTLCATPIEFKDRWIDPVQRTQILEALSERGISFEELESATGQVDADPFDLLCHLAFNAPLKSRHERASRVRRDEKKLFERYGPEARAILNHLLEKYSDFGIAQFDMPEILKVSPISNYGNVAEISGLFGGPERLRQAVLDLQAELYAE